MEQYIVLGLTVLAFAILWWIKRPDVSANEARRLVADGARLIDVRSPGEFASGHVDGAKNIPVGDLDRRTKELQKDRPIILYCASGARSAMAKRTLKGAGFTHVYNLGPMHNW